MPLFFVALLQIILPALMVLWIRNSSKFSSPFRMPGGTPLVVIILLAGIALIVMQVASTLHMLPILG